jgi:hypothetical protein
MMSNLFENEIGSIGKEAILLLECACVCVVRRDCFPSQTSCFHFRQPNRGLDESFAPWKLIPRSDFECQRIVATTRRCVAHGLSVVKNESRQESKRIFTTETAPTITRRDCGCCEWTLSLPSRRQGSCHNETSSTPRAERIVKNNVFIHIKQIVLLRAPVGITYEGRMENLEWIRH